MKTILLVEDEFGIAGVLTLLLEDEGYRVMSAANGRQALNRLAEARPDLVVTDFMMPLLDGAALGEAMRANPAWKDIPIVMMSAVPEAAVRDRFDGYTAFLRKPFPIPAFFDLITGVLKA
ncbi:MAG TPA: response regulator [Azospirillum sp.]|nr:response regulator [Azospirillum sp.]